jgi:hypothetical protein
MSRCDSAIIFGIQSRFLTMNQPERSKELRCNETVTHKFGLFAPQFPSSLSFRYCIRANSDAVMPNATEQSKTRQCTAVSDDQVSIK